MLIPYNGGEAKIDQDSSRVEATKSSFTTGFNFTTTPNAQLFYFTQGLGYYVETIDGTTEIVDNDNLYNPTTGVYTTPANISPPENITFTFEVNYSVRIVNNEAGAVTVGNMDMNPIVNITDESPVGVNPVINGISLQQLTVSGSYGTGATTLHHACKYLTT